MSCNLIFIDYNSVCTGSDVAQAGFEGLLILLPNAGIRSVSPDPVLFYYLAYMVILPTCICVSYACSAHGGQKALNLLGLELQMAARYHVNAGNRNQVFGKSNQGI